MPRGADIYQFDREQVLVCIFAVTVLDLPTSDLDLALRRSAETGEPLGVTLINLELLDESEVRALERMVESVPGGEIPRIIRQSRGAISDDPSKRYHEQYELGAGGMGRILIVEDTAMGREVALKEAFTSAGVAVSQYNGRDELSFRFREEALLTAQLEHPSIVPIYDAGARDGVPFYTMRFIRGRSFLEAVQDARTLHARLYLFKHLIDVAQAIAFAHSREIVHRDISPTNIMLGEFGETVVLDWGLAKGKNAPSAALPQAVDEDRPWKTVHGTALGTPFCMSPEQAEGKINSIDERTDVFAIGALLYLILTGQAPYAASTSEESVARAIRGEYQPAQKLEPQAPNELISIASKAMAISPENRYQSMTELRDELIRFQNGAFLRSHHYSLRDVFRHYSRRHRYALLFSFFCFLAVVGLGIVSYLDILHARNSEARQRELAERLSEDRAAEIQRANKEAFGARMQLAQTHLTDGNYTLAESTLDAVNRSQRNADWDLLRTLATPETVRFRGDGETILSARFSTSGNIIAAIADNHTLKIFDAHEGNCTNNIRLDGSLVTSFTFSPTDEFIAVTMDTGRVGVYQPTGSAPVWSKASSSAAFCASFSPDGTELCVGFEDGALRRWKVADGRLVGETAFNDGAVTAMAFLSANHLGISRPGGPLRVLAYPRLDTVYVKKDAGEPILPLNQGRAAASRNADALLFDAETGENEVQLNGESGKNLFFHADPSKRYIVSTTIDGPCAFWDTRENSVVRTIAINDVCVGAWVADNPLRVVTCGARGTISVWEGQRPVPVYTRTARLSTIAQSDFRNPDGALLVIGGNEECSLWKVAEPGGNLPRFYDSSKDSYSLGGVAVSPAGDRFAARINSVFPRYAFVSLATKENCHTAQIAVGVRPSPGVPVCLSEDEVAFPITKAEVAVWDTKSEKFHVSDLRGGHVQAICAVGPSTDRQIMLATDDGEIALLSRECEPRARFRPPAPSIVTALASTSGGDLAVAGTRDGEVMLFAVEPLALLGVRSISKTAPRSIVVSGTERACWILFADGSVCKWYWQKNEIVQTTIHGNNKSESLSVCPSANSLSINSQYDSLQCFDLESLTQTLVLPRTRFIFPHGDDRVVLLDHSGVIWEQRLKWIRGEEISPNVAPSPSIPPHTYCVLTPADSSTVVQAIQAGSVSSDVPAYVRWAYNRCIDVIHEGRARFEVSAGDCVTLRGPKGDITIQANSRLLDLLQD